MDSAETAGPTLWIAILRNHTKSMTSWGKGFLYVRRLSKTEASTAFEAALGNFPVPNPAFVESPQIRWLTMGQREIVENP